MVCFIAMSKISFFVFSLLLGAATCPEGDSQMYQECQVNTLDKSIRKLLPKDICIPAEYTIDQILNDFDFNKDGKNDVAIRYGEYPLKDGTMRYFSVFEQKDDTSFVRKKDLTSLAKPFIQAFSRSYLSSHPLADSLFQLYPQDVVISFRNDSINIDHQIPDLYHKTYIFIYDNDRGNWFLQKERFWIGELPVWLVRNGDLREELLTKRIYLDEDKIPNESISIDEFDILQSKKRAVEFESEYLLNNYDVFEIGAKN